MSDLARRLDRLESRTAISELTAEYCHGCDAHDRERFAAIWHSDGVFCVGPPFGEPVGPAQIIDVLDRMREAYPDLRHYSSNLVLRFTDDDHADGESDAACEAITRNGSHVAISATYRDSFERREGTWRIFRRELTLNHVRHLS